MSRKTSSGESPDYPGKHKNVVYCGDWSACKHPDDAPGSSSDEASKSSPKSAAANDSSIPAAAAAAAGSLDMTTIPEVAPPRASDAASARDVPPSGATSARRAAPSKKDRSGNAGGLSPARIVATAQAVPNDAPSASNKQAKPKAKGRAHEVSLVLVFHVVMEHPPPTAGTLKRRESEAERRRTSAMARLAAAAGLVAPSGLPNTDASTNSNSTAAAFAMGRGGGGRANVAGRGRARAGRGGGRGNAAPAAGRDGAAAVRLRPQRQAQRAEDGRTHAVRGEHFYHVIYNVPKGGENHPLQFDLVIFTRNATARVHTQNNASFTIPGDVDSEGMHFIFSLTHTVKVNRKLLLRLYDDGMDVGIWCSKELVSQRASRDRPRAMDVSSNARAAANRLRQQPPRRAATAEVGGDGYPSQLSRVKTPAHTKPVKPVGVKVPTNVPDPPPRQAPLPPPGGVLVVPLQRMFEYETEPLVYPLNRRHVGVCGESFQHCTDFEMQSLEVLVAIERGVLLSDVAVDELKPMKVTIERLTHMPSTPLSYEQLAAKSDGVSVKFKVPGHKPLTTTTRPHAKDITFNESHIVLLSRVPVDLLREFLWGAHMVFEVHDRARTQSMIKETQNNYGMFDPDDNDFDRLYGTFRHMEQMRSVYSFAGGRPPYWDPYGRANVNVDRIAKGIRSFDDVVPVLPGPRMLAEQKEQRRLRGVVFGDNDKPVMEGLYVEHGTLLYVSFKLPKPVYIQPQHRVGRRLRDKGQRQAPGVAQDGADKQGLQAKARKGAPTSTAQEKAGMINKNCPYSRIILIQQPACQLMRAQIMEMVACKNIATLGLVRIQTLQEKLLVLAQFILAKKHLDNALLDLFTGFEVADQQATVTVIEGLTPSIQEFIHSLPKPKNGEEDRYKVLYNSEVRFSQRLYMSFSLLLERFAMNSKVSDMLMWRQPYLQRQTLGTVDGVHVLSRLFGAERIEKAVQDGVFVDGPRLAEIANLYCSASTVPGTVSQVERANAQLQKDLQAAVEKRHEEISRAAAESRRKRRREAARRDKEQDRPRFTPIDSHNVSYDELIGVRRKAEVRDFVHKNVLSCKMDNTRLRLPLIRSRSETVYGNHVHIYSTQPFNRDVRRLRTFKEEVDCVEKLIKEDRQTMARARAAADGWSTTEHKPRHTAESSHSQQRSTALGGWAYQKTVTEAEEPGTATSKALEAAAAGARRYGTADESGGRLETATSGGDDGIVQTGQVHAPLPGAQSGAMEYVYADRYFMPLPARTQCSEVDQGQFLRQEDSKKWLTGSGFSRHPHKSAGESRAPAVDVDAARREQLAEPWQENTLHANKLEPTVDREQFSWDARDKDMELYRTAPSNFGAPEPPATILLAGDTLLEERKAAEAMERAQWEQAVLPSHDLSRGGTIRTHRVGTSSELQDGASNQVDRLTDIRKGSAKKHSLRYRPADVPALGVVRDAGVDAAANRRDSTLEAWAERAREATLHEPGEREGFVPGPRVERSIKLASNSMPLDDTRVFQARTQHARPKARPVAEHGHDWPQYEPYEERVFPAMSFNVDATDLELDEDAADEHRRHTASDRKTIPGRPVSHSEPDVLESTQRAMALTRLGGIQEAASHGAEASSPGAEAAKQSTGDEALQAPRQRRPHGQLHVGEADVQYSAVQSAHVEDIEYVEFEDVEDLHVQGAEGSEEEATADDYRQDYEVEERYDIEEEDGTD